MKTIKVIFAVLAATLMLTSCHDDVDTNQYRGGVSLNVFGPSPVARGGQLRFLGSGLNQIQTIEIPGCEPISEIERLNSGEIHITVPQSAQPGYVTLRYKDGEITTKTMLTYTEPIAIESFSPATILPGETLTIKGEYLNLIHEVIFSENVSVTDEFFTKHTRQEIQLVVPEEARSGKITISDGDTEMPNMILSDDVLTVTLPSVEKTLDLTNARPGQTVSIKGSNLHLVKKVVMPDETEVEFSVSDNTLEFALAETASDGAVSMVPASGVLVPIANIGMIEPSDLTISPSANTLRPGQELTIKGKNLDMVKGATFSNVEEPVEVTVKSAAELSVIVPEMARSGSLTLNLLSNKAVKIAVQTAKPANLQYETAVCAGSPMEVTGENLDLVTSVIFFGGTAEKPLEVVPSATSATSLTVAVHPQAANGPVTFVMNNGEAVQSRPVSVSQPVCAALAEVPGRLYQGQTYSLPLTNAEHLTSVTLGGVELQHFVQSGNLVIFIPFEVNGKVQLVLTSDNGEVAYEVEVKASERTIWEGSSDVGNWSGNDKALTWGAFDWSTVEAGTKCTIYLTCNPGYDFYKIMLCHGSGWGTLAGAEEEYDLQPDQTEFSFILTQVMLDDLCDGMQGLVIKGYQFTFTKVTLTDPE